MAHILDIHHVSLINCTSFSWSKSIVIHLYPQKKLPFSLGAYLNWAIALDSNCKFFNVPIGFAGLHVCVCERVPFFFVHFQFILILFMIPLCACVTSYPIRFLFRLWYLFFNFVFAWNTLKTAFYSYDLICGTHTYMCTLTVQCIQYG